MSGHLGVHRTIGNHLSNVGLTDSALTLEQDVAVVVGLRMLGGQVFPQGGLPGKLGVAPGAGYLDDGRGCGMLAVGQPRFVPTSMGRQIGRAREPLITFGTSVLDVGYPGAPVLSQLERVLVELSAKFALIRTQPVFDLSQLRPRLLGDFNDVERRIDVSGDHSLVRTQDHGTGHRTAGVLVELQSSRVFLLRPLQKLLGRASP